MDFSDNDVPPPIRMFPDYADTVLWFVDGPVPYEIARLSRELTEDLKAWEEYYYGALDRDFKFVSEEHAAAFTLRGNELAERVAQEVGHEFVVELHTYEEGVPHRRVTSGLPALNRNAEAAFWQMVALCEEERAGFSAGRGPFTAHIPSADATFTPSDEKD